MMMSSEDRGFKSSLKCGAPSLPPATLGHGFWAGTKELSERWTLARDATMASVDQAFGIVNALDPN